MPAILRAFRVNKTDMRESTERRHGHIRGYIFARHAKNSALIFTLHLSVILVSMPFEANKTLDLFGISRFGIIVANTFDEH